MSEGKCDSLRKSGKTCTMRSDGSRLSDFPQSWYAIQHIDYFTKSDHYKYLFI